MKQIIFIIAALFISQLAFSQILVEDLTQSLFQARQSSIEFFDAENDGDLDVILSGLDTSNSQLTCYLYLNDGVGNYTQSTNTFIGLNEGSIAIGDLDDDNDMDIIISGSGEFSQIQTNVYINDGSGIFSLLANTNLPGVFVGHISIGDIDNDLDGDIIITGIQGANGITKLFINDGNNSFTENTSHSIPNVFVSHTMLIDIDNNNTLDLLISGESSSSDNGVQAKLFLNDGNGNFTLKVNPFIGVHFSGFDIADVDNDSDLDIFICGRDLDGSFSARLYLNDGNSNFTESTANSLLGLGGNDAHFLDIDNDGDMDLIYSGEFTIENHKTVVYINDGNGIYNLDNSTTIEGLSAGSSTIGDYNNDGKIDFAITGVTAQNIVYTKLYKNSSTLNTVDFTEDFNEVKIFPNPVNNILYIENAENLKAVKVYNSLGQLVLSSKDENINFDSFKNGAYLVKILTELGVTTKTIIKK